jgi:hypothetical protein
MEFGVNSHCLLLMMMKSMDVKLKLPQEASTTKQKKPVQVQHSEPSSVLILFTIKSVKESRALALGQAFKGSSGNIPSVE